MNRERLQAVRDRIAAEPPERLDMRFISSEEGVEEGTLRAMTAVKHCGTAACIAGWALAVSKARAGAWLSDAQFWLQLNDDQRLGLFCPEDYAESGRYTQADALAALDSLIHAETDDALPVWPDKAEAA